MVNQDCHTEIPSALDAALKSFPAISPVFRYGTRVLVWKTSKRPYPPPTDCASVEHLCFESEPPRRPGLALYTIRRMSIVGSGGVGRNHNCRIQKGRGGTDIIAKPSAHSFPAAVDPEDRCRRTTPLLPSQHFSSPLVSCCIPLGRLDRKMLVGEQRAPFPGAASRLSAVSSNTLHLPLIYSCTLTQKYFTDSVPASTSREYLRILVAKKYMGQAEREILV
jgi:hypothetical protein